MDFAKVTSVTGGQNNQYRDVDVQADDLIWAQGTASGGGCTLALTNLPASLIGTELQDGGRMRISVWKALASGTARVIISGGGSNWDLLVTVARPDSSPWNWKLVSRYDQTSPFSVDCPIETGNVLFITQHHGLCGQSPGTTGITYTTWDDVLPEGSSSSFDGRMTTRKATSTGTAIVTSPSCYLLVCWVEPVSAGVFHTFTNV